MLTDTNRTLVFIARMLRTFGFGMVSVVLPLYLLNHCGLSPKLFGLALTLTLIEDAIATTAIAAIADRFGRRIVLSIAPLLITVAGAGFVLGQHNVWVLMVVAVVGTISPGGVEAGPFLAVEQAVLSQTAQGHKRTTLLSWYNVAGSLFAALGAGAAGVVTYAFRRNGLDEMTAFHAMLWGYAVIGVLLMLIAARLSAGAEAKASAVVVGRKVVMGLHKSKVIVAKLAGLQGIDALAGGLIVQTIIVAWFYTKFHVDAEHLGPIFFGTNILSAVSFLAAAPLAKRIGLLNTMVFTHLPSNILLAFVPLMPTFYSAVGMLLLRHLLSQMDVPTRQAYTMALVDPDERSAAAGITASVRSVAQSVGPTITGLFPHASIVAGVPFVVCGIMKSGYDLAIWQVFRKVPVPKE